MKLKLLLALTAVLSGCAAMPPVHAVLFPPIVRCQPEKGEACR